MSRNYRIFKNTSQQKQRLLRRLIRDENSEVFSADGEFDFQQIQENFRRENQQGFGSDEETLQVKLKIF